MKTNKITITPDGEVRFIYNDELRALLSEGEARINRASHVEPDGTKWYADLGPVNGPKLGPFDTRQEALDAEIEWLNQNLSQVRT